MMVVNVTCSNQEQSRQAIKKLNGHQLETHALKVSYTPDEQIAQGPDKNGCHGGFGSRRQPQQGSPVAAGAPAKQRHPPAPGAHAPGAFIGQEGAIIQTITIQTQFKIDVHRKENTGAVKAISVHSTPEG